MVDEVLVNAVGLIFGFGVAQVLGDFVESKIKPGVTVESTTQDKIVARVANNGPRLALAYGAYTIGKTSPVSKNIAIGAVLSTMSDVYWRYLHQGAPPSAYVETPIPSGTPAGTPAPTTPAPTTPAPTTPAPTTPAPTTPTTPTSSTSSGQSPGEPDIGLLDNIYDSALLSDTDTLEDIIAKARILEEM